MIFLANINVSPKRLRTFPGCSAYFFGPTGGPGAAGGRQDHVDLVFLVAYLKKQPCRCRETACLVVVYRRVVECLHDCLISSLLCHCCAFAEVAAASIPGQTLILLLILRAVSNASVLITTTWSP